MTNAKGVWLRPTELGEVAEAAVMAAASAPAKQPAASTAAHEERRSTRPVLTVSLGVCCCLLAGLIGLHIFSNDFSLPLPNVSVAVSASQIIPEKLNEENYSNKLQAPVDIIDPPAESGEVAETEAQYEAAEELVALDEVSPPLAMTPEEEGLHISAEPEEEVEIPAPTDETDFPAAAPNRVLAEQPVLASRSGGSADTGEITVGDTVFIYTQRLYLESTAYTWTGNKTATGTWPRVPTIEHPGTIAVDPLVIPLGSRLYVDGYGFAIAEDTGGLIKGNIIDVYFDSREECIKWGRKHGVAVYILE